MIYVTVYNIKYIMTEIKPVSLCIIQNKLKATQLSDTTLLFLLTPKSYDKILWDEIIFKT